MTSDDEFESGDGSSGNRTLERFVPIQRPLSLSDEVAEVLLRRIREGPMMVGTRFPSERELSEQFNVSRTVIREAIRSLAAKGVISVQAGRGHSVSRVEAHAVRESMSLYLLGMDELDYQNVHEVRATIELEVAGLAASRATDDELKELAEVCEQMAERVTDIEFTARVDLEFHRKLAEMTHNPLFVVLLDAISDVLLEIRVEALMIPNQAKEGLEFHRKILTQVAARNPAGARFAMQEHLLEAEAMWRRMGHGVSLHRTPERTEQ